MTINVCALKIFFTGISLHVDTLTDLSADSDVEKPGCRMGDLGCESGSDSKDKYLDNLRDSSGEGRLRGLSPKSVTPSPLTGVEAPLLGLQHREDPRNNNTKGCMDSRVTSEQHNPSAKPKLWSLAEIATSDPKQQVGQSTHPAAGLLTSSTSHATPGSALYPASSLLGRPIYYTSAFYSNYSNYGNFGALQGQGILRYNSSGVGTDGLAQSVLTVNALQKHCGGGGGGGSGDPLIKANPNHLEQHFRSAHIESKKGT